LLLALSCYFDKRSFWPRLSGCCFFDPPDPPLAVSAVNDECDGPFEALDLCCAFLHNAIKAVFGVEEGGSAIDEDPRVLSLDFFEARVPLGRLSPPELVYEVKSHTPPFRHQHGTTIKNEGYKKKKGDDDTVWCRRPLRTEAD